MTDRSIPGVRRPLEYPRLDPADRPDPDELAEQRRAANPHRSSRAKPRTTTTKEETKCPTP
jgi:hypothetical protein